MANENTEHKWGQKPVVLEQTLGDRLRKSLQLAGISVGEMAEALEVHRNTCSGHLADRARPSQLALRFWADRCGVPHQWLRDGVWPDAIPAPAKKTSPKAAAKAPVKKANGRLRGSVEKR